MKARRLRIHGRVQGVFYRGWAVEAARDLRLSGWVRNRRDGSVDMVISGGEDEVGTMIERARRGPPAARVERVDVEETEEEAPPGFTQRPTV
ncbi:MAG TPA: acylphosphatase [Allosphingosinicella sp.]|nr:acylphosphatase [Allosphingosinicella sp.]